ncbi:hypothetical protein EXIGLDRAFT_784419 [Exidia glandulosa HHB12029]|uniref:Uncharacterized protein n=1 Tax=Exidia glandulosa HHB12029 TaxID=1314781 RepID=A0A166MGQ6_EXIGL|nr:hypothetical protein EXIGLDRAFT_784419 [Exidia glandulosa HHB12029]
MIVPDPVAEWRKQQPPWPRTREELVPPMIVSQIEKWDWTKELPSVQDILDLHHLHSETDEQMDVDEKPLMTDKTNSYSRGTDEMKGQEDVAGDPSSLKAETSP